jgi:copper homeostasis protein (lipoprotein)
MDCRREIPQLEVRAKVNERGGSSIRSRAALVAVAAIAIAGCAARDARLAHSSSAAELVAALPATFAGTMPCADCPGVDFTLVVRPDGRYLLRTRYRRADGAGGPAGFDELGLWRMAADSAALVLSSRETSVPIAIVDARTLFVPKPGADGSREGVSADTTDRTLRRMPPAAPFVPRLQLRGIATRDGMFRECSTGLVVPIARERATALDSALREHARVLADVEGVLMSPADVEGSSAAQVLRIARIARVLPGETCE